MHNPPFCVAVRMSPVCFTTAIVTLPACCCAANSGKAHSLHTKAVLFRRLASLPLVESILTDSVAAAVVCPLISLNGADQWTETGEVTPRYFFLSFFLSFFILL